MSMGAKNILNYMFQTIQISLNKLWTIAKQHPELIKEVKFKDGHTEKMLNLTSRASKYPDEHHTEIISAKPKEVQPASSDEWKYWEVGKSKVWGDNGNTPASTPQIANDNEPPF